MSSGAATVLREARLRAGLTQEDLAQRAHVAQPTISAYENGRREPAWSTLRRLVAATGFDLELQLVPVAKRRSLPDTPMGRRLRRKRRAILAVAEHRGIHNVRVFGSVARGEDAEASDIDLLVDLDEGVTLVDLAAFRREAEQIVGRAVDVVPARDVKSQLAERVFAEAVEL